MNRTLLQMLRSYAYGKPATWDEALTLLEFAYNNHKRDGTGQTPFFLNYGMHPRIPLVLDINHSIMEIPHKGEIAFKTCVGRANALFKAKDQLEKAQKKQNKKADTQPRESTASLQGVKKWKDLS